VDTLGGGKLVTFTATERNSTTFCFDHTDGLTYSSGMLVSCAAIDWNLEFVYTHFVARYTFLGLARTVNLHRV
jgi:hypothetical protein